LRSEKEPTSNAGKKMRGGEPIKKDRLTCAECAKGVQRGTLRAEGGLYCEQKRKLKGKPQVRGATSEKGPYFKG